ncbi:MAG: 30S ribosomal protein S6 [Candidatus Omnitrophota bacterium]
MEKLKSYEALFIIVPEKQDAMDEMKNGITAVIKDNSGNVVKDNVVGKKPLAYPIKKKQAGIYYEVEFTAPPKSVAQMTKQFRINTDILRALINTGK